MSAFDVKPTTIVCETCNAPYETKRKNTKLCRVCQIVRDLRFNWKRKMECVICEETFLPLTMKSDPFCGSCDTLKSSLFVQGTCGFCQTKDTTLLHKDLKICRPCSTSPDKRKAFIQAAHKKQAERVKEFAS